MPRLWIAVLAAAMLLFPMPRLGELGHPEAAAARSKASIAGIPLPPRARIQDGGTFRAAQSYRKTVVFFERYLRRQGIPHDRIATYKVRGVQVTRILSTSARSQWLAIHVFKIRGMTHVFIVPRAKAAAPADAAQKNADQP